MKATIEIEVVDETQRAAIARALADPVTRAAMIVTGIVLPFDAETGRRILACVAMLFDLPTSPARPR